ncbi:MAG: NAD-dependent epimerase/dehydratase family protein, partial [Phycisphaerae bacterium]
PYTEKTPLEGRHPYDVSKSCSDLICQTYATTYKTPVIVTRCGNFYGGGDLNWNRIIPGTIRSVIRGQSPVIRSDGSFIRDYFYVEDGAAAYMMLAEKLAERPELAGEAFNLSNETQVTVLQLVEKVLANMNSSLQPRVLGESCHEIIHQSLDATKAREILGWTPIFTLEEGLSGTIKWYTQHFQSLTAARQLNV